MVDIYNVRLIIWDISGSALSSPLLDKYLYDANAVLLTYDITNGTSFLALSSWYNAVLNATINSNPVICLVGNKCDLEHQRTVPLEKQNKFVNDNGLSFHSVSGRTGENVTLSFQKVVAQCLGVKISRLEQEGYNKVLKAEVAAGHNPVVNHYQSSSSVCTLQ